MKKNKISNIFTLLLLLGFAMNVTAKGEEYSDTHQEQFDVEKGVTLHINTEFTNIKAYNWNKDVISIEVNVGIDAQDQKQAQKRFDQISLDINGSSSEVNVEINLIKNFFNKHNNNNIDIETIIYYPSYINLDLENEFGNSLFEDIEGKVSVEVSYGNFLANNLTQTNLNLNSEFGKIDVHRFQGGKVNVSYGGFSAELIGAIKLTSEFSNNNIHVADHLELDTSYDKDDIGSIHTAFIDSEFSNIKIEELTKHLHLETSYGNFRLKKISRDFQLIDIRSEFTGIDLKFMPPLSFSFDAHIDMGNFKYPKELAHIASLDKDMGELDIKGYMGHSKKNTSTVILNIEHATATFKVAN